MKILEPTRTTHVFTPTKVGTTQQMTGSKQHDNINTRGDGLPWCRNVANDRPRLFPRSISLRSAPALPEVMEPSSSSSSIWTLFPKHKQETPCTVFTTRQIATSILTLRKISEGCREFIAIRVNHWSTKTGSNSGLVMLPANARGMTNFIIVKFP